MVIKPTNLHEPTLSPYTLSVCLLTNLRNLRKIIRAHVRNIIISIHHLYKTLSRAYLLYLRRLRRLYINHIVKA